MSSEISAAFTRRAKPLLNRRKSMQGIGLGALVTAVARPSSVKAGKERKKIRKRVRKKCKREIDACRASVTDLCNSLSECQEETLSSLLSCRPLLSNCRAGASLDCFFSKLN